MTSNFFSLLHILKRLETHQLGRQNEGKSYSPIVKMQPRQQSHKERVDWENRKLVGRARRPEIKWKRTTDTTTTELRNKVPSLNEVVSIVLVSQNLASTGTEH